MKIMIIIEKNMQIYPLENDKEQVKEGKGLKILTPRNY